MNSINQEMFQQAKAVREHAYAPYSGFHVGACILSDDNKLFIGCNVENAAFPLGQCAEGSAITAMVSAGYKNIKAIAVIGSTDQLVTPCGACRQKILEFATEDTSILLCDNNGVVETTTIKELLPRSFSQVTMAGS